MVSFNKVIVSGAALLGLVQFCPAPFLLAIPIAVTIDLGSAAAWVTAVGVVAGSGASAASAIEASHGKKKARDVPFTIRIKPRQQYGTQLAWEECHSDLGSATVGFQSAGVGSKSPLHAFHPGRSFADNCYRHPRHRNPSNVHDPFNHHHRTVRCRRPCPHGQQLYPIQRSGRRYHQRDPSRSAIAQLDDSSS